MKNPIPIDFKWLLTPISADNPVGDNIRDKDITLKIEEARRADDAYLPQGDWQTDLKTADWSQVEELALNVLSEQSKDLQTACWLTEALAHRYGFNGIAAGLTFINDLLVIYWDNLHPSIADDGMEERTGRLDWLNATLANLVLNIPLTELSAGGYNWNQRDEAKRLENLAYTDPQAALQAFGEGKISTEIFDKAVANSSNEFYQGLYASLEDCSSACKTLRATVDDRFGTHGPSLSGLSEALDNCLIAVDNIFKQKGISLTAGTSETIADLHDELAPKLTSQAGGMPGSRAAALHQLSEAAKYFKQTEPHSPVSYLVQRAVRWGEMPLEDWLKEVIKEEGVLMQLNDLLGLRPPD